MIQPATKRKESFFESAQYLARATQSNRVIRFFPNTDLRQMHLGLSQLAKEYKVDCANLQPGEFVVFCNKRETGIKIFAPGNTIAYLKSPDNYRLDLRVISLIPGFFNGTKFHYEGALKELLSKRYAKD